MAVSRIMIVVPLCLVLFTGNAWCAACMLICKQFGEAKQTFVEVVASKPVVCCGLKQASQALSTPQAGSCPDKSSDCKKCAGMMSDDAINAAIKPIPVHTEQFAPFIARMVYPAMVPLAAIHARWPAPRAIPPSDTLLALRCALNL